MGPNDVKAKADEGDAGERVHHIVGVVSRRCAVRDVVTIDWTRAVVVWFAVSKKKPRLYFPGKKKYLRKKEETVPHHHTE